MKHKQLIYHFSTDHDQPSSLPEAAPSLQEVGGKGLSLIRMSQAEFNVPDGFVLTAVFFQPWFAQLE
ncbi:MAG: hypothetical protein GY803_32155 [Chloroflexi bacterium]|nr:hypothetical protein [Chloroflexota bacterium]